MSAPGPVLPWGNIDAKNKDTNTTDQNQEEAGEQEQPSKKIDDVGLKLGDKIEVRHPRPGYCTELLTGRREIAYFIIWH